MCCCKYVHPPVCMWIITQVSCHGCWNGTELQVMGKVMHGDSMNSQKWQSRGDVTLKSRLTFHRSHLIHDRSFSVLFTSTHLSIQIVSAFSSFPDFLFSHSPCLVISLPRFLHPLTVCWLNKWPSFILRERPGLMKTWSPCYGVILWSLCRRWMVFFSTSI